MGGLGAYGIDGITVNNRLETAALRGNASSRFLSWEVAVSAWEPHLPDVSQAVTSQEEVAPWVQAPTALSDGPHQGRLIRRPEGE